MTNIYRTVRTPVRKYSLRRLLLALSAMVALFLGAMVAARAEPANGDPVAFDIAAQPVPAAIRELARQAKLQLLFISEGVEGIEANGVTGTFTAQEALDRLLEGTGLTASASAESGISVRLDQGSESHPPSRVSGPKGTTYGGSVAEQDRKISSSSRRRSTHRPAFEQTMEEVIVTGTSIRGLIPESTPLEIYSAEDIANTGVLTVEQFLATLPQNNNTLTEVGPGVSSREPNGEASSAVDLRGLGVGTTLVLLNGRRIAPSSGGRSPDPSFIPINVVKRVEVLTDGASAIYGADAIGGVVNFILKDDLDGAETIMSYGGARGGGDIVRIDQSFGQGWENGNVLIAFSFLDRSALDADERSFSRSASPLSLVPEDTRRNLLVTASHAFSPNTTISADVLFSTKRPKVIRFQRVANRLIETSVDYDQTVLNLELETQLHRHHMALLITGSEALRDTRGTLTEFTDEPSGKRLTTEDTEALDVTAKVDGELFSLPGGEVLYAFGAGYTKEGFERILDNTDVGGRRTFTTLDRTTKYAFTELLVPLISGDQDGWGTHRLEFSLAARYTDYSDFGDKISPKLGILWSPVPRLKLRATVGESFKAPFLFQIDSTVGNFLLYRPAQLGFPDIWTPDGSAIVLFPQGPGNPNLGPEEARTSTLGLDLELAGAAFSLTYFKLDYTDRIAEPDPSGGFVVFGSPQDFPQLFDLNPSLDEVTRVLTTLVPVNATELDIGNPQAVHGAISAYFDNRIQNLAITEMDALDVSIRRSSETAFGLFDLGARVSKIFSYEEQALPSLPAIPRVDTVLFPADLKVRAHAGLQADRWSGQLTVNYVDGYSNPFNSAHPRVDAWTTLDMILSTTVPKGQGGFLGGVRLALSVQNLLDADPPFVAVGTTTNTALLEPVGFDPANANPLGRFVSLQMSKEWW